MKAIVVVLAILLGVPTCLGQPTDAVAARKEAWSKELEGHREFPFGDEFVGFAWSLSEFNATDCEMHVVCTPDQHGFFNYQLRFELYRDGDKFLSIDGHFASSFVSYENKLYFAEYPEDSMGCHVVAYDMSDGSQVWKSEELSRLGAAGHSAYGNQVYLRLAPPRRAADQNDEGEAIVVRGHESFGDYMTVLDPSTGEVLAYRCFRSEFGAPPKNDEP